MQPWYFSANKGIMHVHNRNKGIMIEIVEKISKISCFFRESFKLIFADFWIIRA